MCSLIKEVRYIGVLFSIDFTVLRIWFVIPWFQRNRNSGNGRNDVPSVPTFT